MSRNTRAMATGTSGDAAPRTRKAATTRTAVVRPTRATAVKSKPASRTSDETEQSTIPSASRVRTTRMRATARVDSSIASVEGSATGGNTTATRTALKAAARRTAGTAQVSSGSATDSKPVVRPASKIETMSKTKTARATAQKSIVIQDAPAFIKDIQAVISPPTAGATPNGNPNGSDASSPAVGSQVEIMKRYISRSLAISAAIAQRVGIYQPEKLHDIAPSASSPLSANDASPRAKDRHEITLAKHLINAGLKILLAVYNSGYRFPSPESGKRSTSGKATWSDDDVLAIVNASVSAFRTLDESQSVLADEDSRKACVDLEKIRMVLASRCWMLGMYAKCLDILVRSQSRILSIIAENEDYDLSGTGMLSDKAEMTTSKQPQTIKARNRILPMVRRTAQPQVRKEFLELLNLPIPYQTRSETGSREGNASFIDANLRVVLVGRLIAAWVSVLGMSLTSNNADTLLQYLQNTASTTKLGILGLAIDFPNIARTQHIFQICVALNKLELALPQLKQVVSLQTVKTCVLALCAGEDKEDGNRAPITYEKAWLTLRSACGKCITGAERETDILRGVDSMIRETINIFLASHTEQDRQKAIGSSEWFSLIEFWVDLGRSLNDVAIIEEASAHLGSRNQKQSTDVPDEFELEKQMSSLSLGREEAQAKIRLALAEFSRLMVVLESMEAKDATKAVIDLPARLQAISESVPLLESQYPETLVKISRSIRALQHRMEILTTESKRWDSGRASSEWIDALNEWLRVLIPFITDILARETTAEVPVKYQVDLAAIAIQAALDLSKRILSLSDFSSHALALDILEQAHNAVSHCRTNSDDKAEWLALLSASFYNRGVTLYLGEFHLPALPFIKRSVEIAQHLLLQHEAAEQKLCADTVAVLAELATQYPKRLELLAACHIKKGDKMNGLATYLTCLATPPRATLDQLTQMAERLPATEAVRAFPGISTLLNRLGSFLQKEALYFDNNFSEVERLLGQCVSQDVYKGIILEYVLDALGAVGHRSEVAAFMCSMCQSLISIYTPDVFPVRRLRVAVRLMELSIASGWDEWDAAEAEATLEAVGEQCKASMVQDQFLRRFQQQYVAQGYLCLAMASYRIPSAGMTFSSHAKRAVSLLQTCIPRSSNKAAAENKTSKPARRIARQSSSSEQSLLPLDNPLRLDQQLENLANTLGVYSHGLHRIEILRLRRGLQRHASEPKSAYVLTTSQLALEYARLGKYKRAESLFNVARAACGQADYRSDLSNNDLAAISLRYALYLAWTGDASNSLEIYEDTRRRHQAPLDKNGPSTTAKIRAKTDAMHLVALSNALLSEISILKNDIAAAARHGATAFRLWNRAVDNLARIAVKYRPDTQPSTKPRIILDDPFGAAAPAQDPQDVKALDEEAAKRTIAATTTESRLSGTHLAYTWSLLESTIRLGQTHLIKGSAKQAEAYAMQAQQLALALNAGIWKAKSSLMLAAIYIKTESLGQAKMALADAKGTLEELNSPESAVCALWLNRLHMKSLEEDEAEHAFQSLLTIIGNVEQSLAEVEQVASTPIKPSTARTPKVSDPALSELRAQGIRQRARQLRLAGNIAGGESLLQQCLNLEFAGTPSVEHKHIMGYLLLSKVLDLFKTDLFLNSVTESSISMPMGAYIPEGQLTEQQAPSAVLAILADAEKAFETYLMDREQTGNVEDVRDAAMSSALLKVYRSSLGQKASALTSDTVNLLDKSCALTLHREMLELIDSQKFGKNDEMLWPSIKEDLRRCTYEPAVSEGDSLDDLCLVKDASAGRVESTQRFECFAKMDADSGEALRRNLPDGWSVVTINLTEDQNTLFISRQQSDREPIVFAISLNRQNKKEEDEEAEFTFLAAITELRAIIESSDDTARNAKNVDTREGRIHWWNTRKTLDKRLETLLRDVEYSWLGAFKTIFNPVDRTAPASLSAFKSALERIFRTALSRQDKTKVNQVRLQASIIECFSSLSSKSDEQEIEDLVYYLLDLYLYNGVPVALAELDIEQLIIDVQSALSTFENDCRNESVSPRPEEHIFLILDRHVQELPWESIPILRGRPISRIPSTRFLLDRLVHFPPALPKDALNEDDTARRHLVNAGDACFILNAAGDLKQTQARFGEWLGGRTESHGWKGIVNRHPSELEVAGVLEKHDLVLYFGHGGMEQYIRSQKIRNLKRCATTMLWGCSSGILKHMGELDRTGTPYNYMLAGCPSLTAMLWDVTDKDVDKMAEAVMQDLRLMPTTDGGVMSDSRKSRSIAQAVGSARNQCKLKYLTGAAAVTYGIPVYIRA